MKREKIKMGRKIFISYRADDEGTRYKNLLVAWSRNDNGYFDIKYEDTSVGVSINSTDAAYIKRVIKSKIDSSDTVLVLVGKNTAGSEWVNWEIETADEKGKKFVVVKIDNSYDSPMAIFGKGAIWAKSFKYESIKKAIDG